MSFNKVKDKFLTESASFVLVIVGLLILVTSLVLFIFKTSSLSVGAPIDSGIFDHFGSLIGGLVGSIWALAGFILFYVALTEQKKSTEASIDALNLQKEELKLQRTELKMQRDELKDTRKEFEIERITTLIFKQLDRIDTIINSVNVDLGSNRELTGNEALKRLNRRLEVKGYAQINGNEIDVTIADNLHFMLNRKHEIVEFFTAIETSYKVINSQLALTSLVDEDKTKLVSIFAENIYPEYFKAARKIAFLIKSYKGFEPDDFQREYFLNTHNGAILLKDSDELEKINMLAIIIIELLKFHGSQNHST